jgi:hypothetical protein
MTIRVIPSPNPTTAIRPADVPDVYVVLPATFVVDDPVLEGIRVNGSLGADPRTNTVTVDEIRLHRQPDGPSITYDHLRKVQIPRIVEAAIRELGHPIDPENPNVIDLTKRSPLTQHHIASFRGTRKKRGEPTPFEFLQEVADVYNEDPEHRPKMRVAEHFGWNPSMASRYIRQARDAELIDERPFR